MPKNKLLEQIKEIHTSEILGGNQECKVCGENKVKLDIIKQSKPSKQLKKSKSSKSSKSHRSNKVIKIVLIILLLVVSIILMNNITISDYLNVECNTFLNLLNNKFLAIKDFFVNKNV